MPRDHVYDSGHKSPTDKQMKILVALGRARGYGMTPREMAKIEDPGNVSAVNMWGGCFTELRREKLVQGITEQREGHHVCVLPEYVGDRETWDGYTHKGTPFVIVREVHCKTCTCEEKS